MSLEDLYCDVDEFCRMFLPAWHRRLLADGGRRRRASRLTLGEIMTILICFHQSQYRNFKAFYLLHLCRHGRGAFPDLLSYNRFVALIPTALMPMHLSPYPSGRGHRDRLYRRDFAGGLPQSPHP